MKYIASICALILITSCASSVKMVKDPAKSSPKIVMSKGACFGECPVYTLTIYNSGLMKFNGVRYTKMDGKHERQLSEEEYIALIKRVDKLDLWNFEDMYDLQIADLPTTTISYSREDKTKTIKSKSEKPEPIRLLEKELEELIFNAEWEMKEAPIIPEEEKPEIIKEEIIIKGTNQMILVKWLKKYQDYGVRIGKRLGPESDYWLIRYDGTLIDADDLLKKIQEDPEIEEAEFNKVVKPRKE